MSGFARLAQVAALSAAIGSPGAARANGAFPASGQILIEPGDPARMAAKTSYGVVTTTDGGATWTWTCEAAMFVPGGDFHPQLAMGPGGELFGGLPDGLVRGRIGACTWDLVPELDGRTVVDVSQGLDGVAIAAVRGSSGDPGEVWASDDGAVTWAPIGAPLPDDIDPFTLDAAPSDPTILYVSGMLDKDPPVGGLARSGDGGATWSTFTVPRSDPVHAPYIAAIDPADPDVIWMRLDGAPGELLRSIDGGVSFQPALRGEGFIRAFALSPDGTEVLAGGEADGLLRASVDDLESWTQVADLSARCAVWREDAIDVCGIEPGDPFSVGRSVDDGATFQPLYRQQCLDGPEPCPEGSPVAACEDGWPALRASLGPFGCDVGSGGSGPGPSSNAATTGPVGSSASGSVTAASGAGGAGSEDGAAPAGDPGCGCGTGSAGGGGVAAVVVMMVAAALRRRRPEH